MVEDDHTTKLEMVWPRDQSFAVLFLSFHSLECYRSPVQELYPRTGAVGGRKDQPLDQAQLPNRSDDAFHVSKSVYT